MSTINDDVLAFPCEKSVRFHEGMTLRDYFAAKAMLTVFCPGGPNNQWVKIEETFDCAQRCYAIADAMLRARIGSAP